MAAAATVIVTQAVVETLTQPTPAVRITQVVVELLASRTAAPVTATAQTFIVLPV